MRNKLLGATLITVGVALLVANYAFTGEASVVASNALSLEQVNGDGVVWATQSIFSKNVSTIRSLVYGISALLILFGTWKLRGDIMKKFVPLVLAGLLFSMTTGCGFIRPYKKPRLEKIAPNETAYLINLIGDTKGGQAKFASVEYLDEQKVASKEIEIAQRWIQTGRRHNVGEWIPSQMLIKVDRTPVARRWTAEPDTGTSQNKQLLEAESKDSIGVSSGFAITAYIQEKDTSKFLYKYPNNKLSQIIDNQIFNDCQAVYAEIAAKYDVNELRLHKDEINDAIRKKVIPEYLKDGITIKPTLGLIGGLVYDNPEIQKSIDAVFMAQTLEAKRVAERDAQAIENERILSIEQTDANRRKVKADAEAYEINAKVEAISKGGTSYLELLRLEVAKAAMDKWNGAYPKWMSGGVDPVSILVPAPTE